MRYRRKQKICYRPPPTRKKHLYNIYDVYVPTSNFFFATQYCSLYSVSQKMILWIEYVQSLVHIGRYLYPLNVKVQMLWPDIQYIMIVTSWRHLQAKHMFDIFTGNDFRKNGLHWFSQSWIIYCVFIYAVICINF